MTLVSHDLSIPIDGAHLRGTLALPERAEAVILFAHGSGSSRLSPRNARVAHALHQRGLGTLLFDLLTSEEAREDDVLRSYRFDIELLAERLEAATSWLRRQRLAPRTLAYFGAAPAPRPRSSPPHERPPTSRPLLPAAAVPTSRAARSQASRRRRC